VHFGSPAEIFGVDGIIILVVVVLVLFGSTQIPKLARSLGSAQKEFKKGLDEGASEDGKGTAAAAQVAPPAAVAPAPPATPPAAATPPPQTTVTVETGGDAPASPPS
jgi:sec-independent protein translocase protein TatA